MFTGLILECGVLAEDPVSSEQGGVRLTLEHSAEIADRLSIGASLAVSGVCLTIVELASDRSAVELSPETLARTTLGDLRTGGRLNLEPSLRVGDPLGGHWVQGHVDSTIRVLERRDLGEHRELVFELPPDFAAAVVEKGSVALDGVSLTVATRERDRFSVALIPHTLEVTNLSQLGPGSVVNFEADILAKYVQQAARVHAGG